jgi:phosphate acetyltransferase
MSKNIYIASSSRNSGKSIICLGLINAFRGMVGKVGYFKPIGNKYKKHSSNDKEVLMIKETFELENDINDMNPLSQDEALGYIANNQKEDFVKIIQQSFIKIEKDNDVVFIDGTDYIGGMNAFEFDINADIANNLNASILLVIDGHNKSNEDIISDILTCKDSLDENSTHFLGVIINKVEGEDISKRLNDLRKNLKKKHIELFGIVPYNRILPKPRINDIAKSLEGRFILGEEYASNIAIDTIIASMEFENALSYIKNGTLIITGGDRNEIILGSIVSYISTSYPNVSGLVLTGNLLPNENIQNLIKTLDKYIKIPIISVKHDTITTVNNIKSLVVHISSTDKEKIEIGKGLINEYTDYKQIYHKLNIERVKKRTPEIFKFEIIEKAKSNKKRIVLPEGDEPRTLQAVQKVRSMDIADITLLGNPEKILEIANSLNIILDDKVEIIEPQYASDFEEYAETYYELRKHKNLPEDYARDMMKEGTYYGTMMIYKGKADGMVSGAAHTTAHTIRPALEIIKTKSDIKYASSIFFMCLKDRVLVYGDCAIIPIPNAEQLACIAVASADTAKAFEVDPYVALLSYSTGTSGKGPEVEKVREATKLVKEMRPDLRVEGPIQYDAAISPDVAKIKLPDSDVAGRASVFIFPDLNTGNNTYKAVQRASNAIAIGPVLQGLKKPVNDLSRGCLVDDIVYTIAITAIQAQENQRK